MEFLQEFLTAGLRFILLILVWKALFAWAPSCARCVAGALRRRNIRVRFGSLTPEEKLTLGYYVHRCSARGEPVFVEIRRRSVIQSHRFNPCRAHHFFSMIEPSPAGGAAPASGQPAPSISQRE